MSIQLPATKWRVDKRIFSITMHKVLQQYIVKSLDILKINLNQATTELKKDTNIVSSVYISYGVQVVIIVYNWKTWRRD